MPYLSSKMWSDKARAAALAKRRGRAGPPQQSATAADAVAHANALIASGALSKKPKGGKGKASAKAPKPKDPAIAKEKAARAAEHQADRQQRQTEHAASQAEHAQRQQEHVADRTRQATERTQRQAEHQRQLADKAKATADKAKAAKEKAKSGGSSSRSARAAQQEKADRQQAQSELSDAASALANGGQLTEQQAQRLVDEGLAQPRSYGGIELTPKGRTAAKRPKTTTKGMPMPATKANRRNSASDASYHQTVHDGAVERGAACVGMKAAARYSGSDLSHVQGMHDSSVALGAECAPVLKAVGDELAAPLDTGADDEAAETGEDDEEVEGDGHTGLMIALQVPPDVAAELAIDSGLAPEDLHLTLCFLGDAADFQKQQFAILAAVEKVIADAQPLDATIGGVGRFITTEDDGTNAFYASVDCPELVDFRQSLIDALSDLDIAPDTSHGFTPHITLAYVDAGAPTPGDMPTVSDLTFDTVIVAFGDHQVVFPLGDPVADEAALEAEQGDALATTDTEPLMKSVGDDTLIAYGGALKSLPNGHVGGYLVHFSGPNDPDLTGDFFTPDTDFGFEPGETLKTAVYFNHRLPLKTRDGGQMVVKQKIGSGTLSMDETGVFIDAVLYNRERYESTLRSQGWSSGTASHLVDREPVGKSMWVKSWQLGLDASITPTPAEPRTSVLSLKSFLAETQRPQARSQAARTAATSDAAAHADAAPDILIIVKR